MNFDTFYRALEMEKRYSDYTGEFDDIDFKS